MDLWRIRLGVLFEVVCQPRTNPLVDLIKNGAGREILVVDPFRYFPGFAARRKKQDAF